MKWFKKWFKKEQKFDFNQYNINLNIKSICLYERLTRKSFYEITDIEDIMKLMYSSLVMNNDLDITYEAFKILTEDPKIAQWIYFKYMSFQKFNEQLTDNDEVKDSGETKHNNPLCVSDLANQLIMMFHVDAHYVMEEMEFWELEKIYHWAEVDMQGRWEENRFWTYLTILPHIDGKKVKSPKDLIAFDWEKPQQYKLDDAEFAEKVKRTFEMMNKKKTEENTDG